MIPLMTLFVFLIGIVFVIALAKGESRKRRAANRTRIRVTCPSCRTVLMAPKGRVRCSACRTILSVTAAPPPLGPPPLPRSSEPPSSLTSSFPTSQHKTPWRALGFTVAGLGVICLIALILGPRSTASEEDRLRANARANMKANRSANTESRTSAPGLGETAGIVNGHGFWPCGSSEAAFSQVMKWAALGDNAELKRTMLRTHSIGLVSGLRVKILDVGFDKRKVRVLGMYMEDDENNNKMRLFTEDPRTGRECWVVSEALTGAKDQSP